MARKQQSILKTTVSIVLALILLAGIAGAAVFFFKPELLPSFTDFYVIHDGEELTGTNEMTFNLNQEAEFEVKYTWAVFRPNTGFNLQIVPNDDIDFDFTVDGDQFSFAFLFDLLSGFEIDKDAGHFSIVFVDIGTVLDRIYAGRTVVLPSNLDYDQYFCSMLIKSYDNSATVRIDFKVNGAYARGIELDQTEVILW